MPPTASHFMTKGKIVLVPFPFDDLTVGKLRPALCLTEPISTYRHVVMAFISSQVPAHVSATDVVIDPSNRNFVTTGLRVPSVLRLHRLVTLTTAIIRRELGELSLDLQNDVDRKLTVLFGLKVH